ncbi:MAG: phage holin family protein [Endomicrobium sp.]|nr:phage holin family protein [Endomicrobium sp.]
MKHFLIKCILNGLALFIVVNIIPGMEIDKFSTLAAAAIVIAVLNAVIKPILIICTLPINILTLGLFTLVINALLMSLASGIIKNFYIKDFMSAFWGALLFSVVSIILSLIFGGGRPQVRIDVNGRHIR